MAPTAHCCRAQRRRVGGRAPARQREGRGRGCLLRPRSGGRDRVGADGPSQQGFDSVPQVRRGREAHCVCDDAPGCGEAPAGGQLSAPADGPGTLAGLPTASRAQVWRVLAVRASLDEEGGNGRPAWTYQLQTSARPVGSRVPWAGEGSGAMPGTQARPVLRPARSASCLPAGRGAQAWRRGVAGLGRMPARAGARGSTRLPACVWGPLGPRVEANFPQVGESRAPSQTCVPRAQHTEASLEEGGLAWLEGGQPGLESQRQLPASHASL